MDGAKAKRMGQFGIALMVIVFFCLLLIKLGYFLAENDRAFADKEVARLVPSPGECKAFTSLYAASRLIPMAFPEQGEWKVYFLDYMKNCPVAGVAEELVSIMGEPAAAAMRAKWIAEPSAVDAIEKGTEAGEK